VCPSPGGGQLRSVGDLGGQPVRGFLGKGVRVRGSLLVRAEEEQRGGV
jgi:hypothetical protein